jgi:hypothetical protein
MVGTIGPATSDYCAAKQTSAADVNGNRPPDALRTEYRPAALSPGLLKLEHRRRSTIALRSKKKRNPCRGRRSRNKAKD